MEPCNFSLYLLSE